MYVCMYVLDIYIYNNILLFNDPFHVKQKLDFVISLTMGTLMHAQKINPEKIKLSTNKIYALIFKFLYRFMK
jgi:hypothetical protein